MRSNLEINTRSFICSTSLSITAVVAPRQSLTLCSIYCRCADRCSLRSIHCRCSDRCSLRRVCCRCADRCSLRSNSWVNKYRQICRQSIDHQQYQL